MKIFTIHDSKAEAYIQPFFAINEGVALRLFQTAAMDEHHDFHRHAADYTLFEIAEFDEITGTIEPLQAIKNLGNAISVQKISKIQGE